MKPYPRNFWPQVASIVLTCLILPTAIAAFFYSGAKVGMPLAALTFCTATAARMRFGWKVPSFVFGAIVGEVLDPSVKSGEIYYQELETVQYVATAAFVGLLIGFVLDASFCAVPQRSGTNTTIPESPQNEVP